MYKWLCKATRVKHCSIRISSLNNEQTDKTGMANGSTHLVINAWVSYQLGYRNCRSGTELKQIYKMILRHKKAVAREIIAKNLLISLRVLDTSCQHQYFSIVIYFLSYAVWLGASRHCVCVLSSPCLTNPCRQDVLRVSPPPPNRLAVAA